MVRNSIDDYDDETLVAYVRELFASSTEGLTTNDAIRALARTLDFARAGARINERLRRTLTLAARRQVITNERGTYLLLTRSIADYTRDQLIEHLLAATGRAWCERDEAIRLSARRLGFRRTGRRITEAFKSVINGAIRRGLLEYDGQLIRKNRIETI